MTGRFVRHEIASKNLGASRGLTVRLPDNYDPEQKSYPVVYMHDGQNMFDSRTGFAGQEWHVDETVASLNRQGRMSDAILVAVDNAPSRLDDYSHVADPQYGGGKGQIYEKFLMQEVLPAVESTYSVDPKQRVLMGSSMGGLVSLATGIANPGAFAAIGALSPSVWWANGQMAEQILQTPQGDGAKPRVWLDMGTEEGGSDNFGQRPLKNGELGTRPEGGNGVQDVRDRTREAGEALLSQGWELDNTLRYHEPLGARHDEHSWSQRMGDVLSWLTQGMQAS